MGNLCFENFTGSRKAVEDGDDMNDLGSCCLDRFDGLEGGTAGGGDILNHNDSIPLLERTFHELAGAVPLSFLPNDESSERPFLKPGNRENGSQNRICSKGHSTHRIEGLMLQKIENPPADESRSFRRKGHLAAIDVVSRTLATRQDEVAELQSIAFDNVDQRLTIQGNSFLKNCLGRFILRALASKADEMNHGERPRLSLLEK